VHHAVAGADISGGNLGLAVNRHPACSLAHRQLVALQCLDLLLGLEVLAVHGGAGNHVVLQDGIQLFDVFGIQQSRERGPGELGERLVGRGEDGEGAGALESGDELARFDGSHKSGQVRGARGEFNDVFAVGCGHEVDPLDLQVKVAGVPSLMAIVVFPRAEADAADRRQLLGGRGAALRLATPRLRARLERDLDGLAYPPGSLEVDSHRTHKLSLLVSHSFARFKRKSEVCERLRVGLALVSGVDAQVHNHGTVGASGAPVAIISVCTHGAKPWSSQERYNLYLSGPQPAVVRHIPDGLA